MVRLLKLNQIKFQTYKMMQKFNMDNKIFIGAFT